DRHEQRLQQHVLAAERMQREAADEAAEPLHPDAVDNDEQEDGDRESEHDVEIGAGNNLEMPETRTVRCGGQQIDRDHVHQVEAQHPAEDGEREGGDQLALALESGPDLGVHELDDPFDEVLELAGHAGGGLAGSGVEGAAEYDRKQDREKYTVQIDDGKIEYPPRCHIGEEGDVVSD